MNAKQFLLPFTCLGLLAFCLVSPCCGAGAITFDDLSVDNHGSFITNGYQGFNWGNFGAGNAVLFTATNGVTGVYYGMVSPSNVAINAGANPAEIASPSTNFNFLSAYLTGAYNSNLNIEVQGFSGANLLYDTNVVASATSPTMFVFNYLNIDRLHFSSSGGEPAGFPVGAGGPLFVMDDLSLEFVPEPSTVLMTALAVLTLCAFLKRKPG